MGRTKSARASKLNGMLRKLKNSWIPFLFVVMMAACGIQKPVPKIASPEISTEDSTEYELIVFDAGFETWYLLKKSPATDRGIDYYRNWNVQYVSEWNYRSGTSRQFGPPIYYDPHENYPFEIEHKLYYYYQYVENELNIPILQGRSRALRLK